MTERGPRYTVIRNETTNTPMASTDDIREAKGWRDNWRLDAEPNQQYNIWDNHANCWAAGVPK